MDHKDTNPKQAVGDTKVPMHQIPLATEVMISLGHLDGILKYGQRNFDNAGVRLSTYIGAIKRHTSRMQEGEWLDQDSGLPHIAHILTCASIIANASARGMLYDDRPPGFSEIGTSSPQEFVSVDEMMRWGSEQVVRLKARYVNRDAPRHFTIDDTLDLAQRQFSEHAEFN